MTRRALLAGACLVGSPAAAQDFPASISALDRRLVLNGTGTRTWSPLRIAVYRAALYLERPQRDAAAILGSDGVALVRARYLRAVGHDDVVAAWSASFQAICGCAMPDGFRAWLRPISADDVEDQLFAAGGATVSGPGRPVARIAGPAARILLECWIGADVPPASLRRGLLGLD